MAPEQIDVIHTSVFADGVGGGNPCPVVLDASEMTTEQMQSIAHRFGHECGFVVSRRDEAVPRLRYFVPEHEMSMCVHATVAVVALLVQRGRLTGNAAIVAAPVGTLHAKWTEPTEEHGTPDRVEVEQFDPVVSEQNPTAQAVADVLDISVDAIEQSRGPIESVSVSRPKLIVPIVDAATLHVLRPRWEPMWQLCEQFSTTGIYAFAPTTTPNSFDARQFPVRAGYPEDPATGVAAGALAAYLVAHEAKPNGESFDYRIHQGRAMSRPSRIDVSGIRVGRRAGHIMVAGTVLVTGSETLQLTGLGHS